MSELCLEVYVLLSALCHVPTDILIMCLVYWRLVYLGVLHAEFLHVKPGKGAAFVRTKLKNYISGNVVERTFRAGESATQAVLEKRDCQFTYQDGEEV